MAVAPLPLMLLALAGVPTSAGGPHADHAARPPRARAPLARPAAPPTRGPPPDVWVYGYYATWAGALSDLQWDRLTHVAVFSVDLKADGSLDGESLWWSHGPEAVALAAPHGVRVHLTLTCFDDAIMAAVLPDATRRATTITRLSELVDGADAHGVSVDCEGMDAALRAPFVDFVAELGAAVDEVTVALPAIDWSDAYDYGALAEHADALFIMGYDYHWSGGEPGPVAPLFGGDPWSDWSLAWTVSDYRAAGVGDDKLVLGLPLYGRDWPTTDTTVPGSATGRASAVFLAEAVEQADVSGRLFDDTTATPYTFPDATSQLWYDDTDSIQRKVAWAVDGGLRGVGFWALNYESGDPDFWSMIRDETVLADGPADTGDARDTGTTGGGGPGPGGDGGDGAGDASDPTGERPGVRVPMWGCGLGAPATMAPALLALWGIGRRRRASGLR